MVRDKSRKVEVLIVEDSITQLRQTEHILRKSGYTVRTAACADEAMGMLEKVKPDLIISDIVMPGTDGYEFCRKTKSNPDLRSVPFILLTTLSDVEDIIKSLACGADNYITKPYDEEVLLSRIEDVLDMAALPSNENEERSVEIVYGGKSYFMHSKSRRILQLLLSTVDNYARTNRGLVKAERELRNLNRCLEEKVEERTKVLMQEVEHRKNTEEQLRQSQKMEAIGRLTGGIAHNFNNLLTGILGYSEYLLESKLTEGDECRSEIIEIKHAGERAAELTQQLLAFSSRQKFKIRIIDLNDLISSLQGMLSHTIGEDIEIHLDLDPGVGNVKVDPGQIEQVILFLAINARDAMPDGGELRIKTMREETDGGEEGRPRCVILISDNGCGMNEDVLSHIFDPFYTTKERGRGTGLGLSTAYGIMKQSGGSMEVRSVPGKGTTFIMSLPAVDEPVSLVIESEDINGQDHGTETVLIIEDDSVVRTLASRILRDRGCTVYEASNGADAIDRVKTCGSEIELIVTDVVLPKINGPALMERIRSAGIDAPVIYMSGYPSNVVVQWLVSREEPFLQKPFTPNEFLHLVRSVLRESRT